MRESLGVAGVAALAAFLAAGTARADPIITLPVNDITVLTYTGYETFHDVNGNRIADPGDFFTGIFQVVKITNASGTVDLSGQLAAKELTGAFSFHVTGGSSPSGHVEFGLAPGDFFSMFVGTGATKNYDPTAPDAFARATDGQPWISVQPGAFFVSVNDLIGGAPVNRAWANLTENDTGYTLTQQMFLDLLGKPSLNSYGGIIHGDYFAQMDFENHSAPSDLPAFTFKIGGFIFADAAVPEPSSLALLGLGGLALVGWRRRMQRAAA